MGAARQVKDQTLRVGRAKGGVLPGTKRGPYKKKMKKSRLAVIKSPEDNRVQQYQPTEQNKEDVSALAVNGLTEKQISDYLGISIMSLRKYFGKELTLARHEKLAAATNSLFKQVKAGNIAAIIYYLKTQGRNHGWAETLQPPAPPAGNEVDVSKLTMEELVTYRKLRMKMAVGASSPVHDAEYAPA